MLKLPINRVNIDTGCDQGYGSERSPEDELPPPLPLLTLPYQHPMPLNYDKQNGYEYSFITQGKFNLKLVLINKCLTFFHFCFRLFCFISFISIAFTFEQDALS